MLETLLVDIDNIFTALRRIRQTLWRRCADANLKLLPNDT